MEIVDNFINPILQDRIEKTVLHEKFIWNYSKSGTTLTDKNHTWFVDSNTTDTPQFVHQIYNDIEKQPLPYEIETILYCMEDYFNKTFSDRLIRIKINMLTKNPTYPIDNYHIPHSDYANDASESAIYYVNDSDGDTFIFNEKPDLNLKNISIRDRITPVKGRLVLFDSSYLHASSSPIINSERIVINFVFNK